MPDPLSLALPLAVHLQPFGAYADAARLDRSVVVELRIVPDLSPDAAPGDVLVRRGDVLCRGQAPTRRWSVQRCEPSTTDACGLDFEVDLRLDHGVLQTRARQGCAVEQGLWPAATSLVKVNPLALALRETLDAEGGSEITGVLNGATKLALGEDPEATLRVYGGAVVRALGALGLAPDQPDHLPLTTEIYERVAASGPLEGAFVCMQSGPPGEVDVGRCFQDVAERAGAMAVYRALAQGQLVLGDACALSRSGPDGLPRPTITPAPGGGLTRSWDLDGDGEPEHDELYDAAGRLLRSRDLAPVEDAAGRRIALMPAWEAEIDARGARTLLRHEVYDRGRYSETWAYTPDRRGRSTWMEARSGAQGSHHTWTMRWDRAGWPLELVSEEVDPYATVVQTRTFVRDPSGDLRMDLRITRGDQSPPLEQRLVAGRLLERLPEDLIGEAAAPDETPPLQLLRDAAGRPITLRAPNGYETRWAYTCADPGDPRCAGGTVEMTCQDPTRECRPRTFTCAP